MHHNVMPRLTKAADAFTWIKKPLVALLAAASGLDLAVQIHITGLESRGSADPSLDDPAYTLRSTSGAGTPTSSEPLSEKGVEDVEKDLLGEVSHRQSRITTIGGRPDIEAEVSSWVAEQRGSVAVVGELSFAIGVT